MNLANWIADVIAAVAAIFALGAWRAAQTSASAAVKSADAAKISASATEKLAAIEQDRRHEHLAPDMIITCRAQAYDQAELSLLLVGPAALERLDEVTVSIRDDIEDRKPVPGTMLTAEQIAGVIWGPYRIAGGVSGVDMLGRVFGPFPLPKDESFPIPLRRPAPPPWNPDPTYWRQRYDGQPVRLSITCRWEGHEPWAIQRTVPVEPPSDQLAALAP